MFIWIFVHLRNPINGRQIELLIICLYSEGSEARFVVVQHFWCRKIRQIVCRIPRKLMESKFLDQDVDVVFLANKGIVIWSFVGRNYNKILMETGKFMDNIRVTKMDSTLVLTECLSHRILEMLSTWTPGFFPDIFFSHRTWEGKSSLEFLNFRFFIWILNPFWKKN